MTVWALHGNLWPKRVFPRFPSATALLPLLTTYPPITPTSPDASRRCLNIGTLTDALRQASTNRIRRRRNGPRDRGCRGGTKRGHLPRPPVSPALGPGRLVPADAGNQGGPHGAASELKNPGEELSRLVPAGVHEIHGARAPVF